MNAVLYGVDTRAAKEIAELTDRIGEENLIDWCGNALTSQSVGPKILWFRRHFPDLFASTYKIVTSTSYLVYRLTGRYVIDHYSAANSSPLYRVDRLVERRACRRHYQARLHARSGMDDRYRRRCDAAGCP